MNGRLDAIEPAKTRRLRSLEGRLADAATPPLPAAAAAAATTATAATPAAPATAASTTAATTPPGNFVTKLRLSALLVEDIEGRQADVGKLFLAEDDLMIWRGLLRRQVRYRRPVCCGRGATCERQQTYSPQHRYRFRPALALRSVLRVRHRELLPFGKNVGRNRLCEHS